MKIETILNAMVMAQNEIVGYENWGWNIDWKKRGRQYRAFRARILRMDADHRGWIYSLRIENEYLEKELAEKDERIKELEEVAQIYGESIVNSLRIIEDG
jgi:flagellar motility protein MotE (MotC chaperone)